MPLPRLSKSLPSRKFRREEKCERKPSGCPFAFNHPPRRQNCKIRCYNILFCNSGSSLAKKARRDFFDKLGSGQPGPAHCCRSEQAVDKTGKAKGLSLRGDRRPTWQSRAGNYDFADSFPTIRPGTARLPRAQSALAMTILEASRHRIHVPHAAGLHGAQGAPLQTQLVHTVLTVACTDCKCLPEIATGAKRPRNDNLGGIYHFNDSLYGRQVRRRARHASPLLFHTYRSGGQMSFSAEKTGRFSGKKFQKALAFRVFQCYNKDNL